MGSELTTIFAVKIASETSWRRFSGAKSRAVRVDGLIRGRNRHRFQLNVVSSREIAFNAREGRIPAAEKAPFCSSSPSAVADKASGGGRVASSPPENAGPSLDNAAPGA